MLLKINKVDLERTQERTQTKPTFWFEANSMVRPAIAMDSFYYGEKWAFLAEGAVANEPTRFSNSRYMTEYRAVACGKKWIPAFAGMTDHGDVSYSGFGP